ncbi:MAG: isocitrate lyase/phosphoenolpyruvate mutase family protein, partial [Pirellula sp.]
MLEFRFQIALVLALCGLVQTDATAQDKPSDAQDLDLQWVGGSIEDATGDPDQPLFDIETASARIKAAVDAARSLPVPFLLSARAEGFLRG